MRYIWAAISALGIAVAFLCGWFAGSSQISEETTALPHLKTKLESMSVGQPRVVAQGKLLPATGIVNVMIPPNQRVLRLEPAAHEGEMVTKDLPLAVLEGATALQLRAELAKSQARDAERELNQKISVADGNRRATESGLRLAEVQLSQAMNIDLAQPEKQLEISESKLNKMEALASDEKLSLYVSQWELEETRAAIEMARSQLSSATKEKANAVEIAGLQVEIATTTRQQANNLYEELVKLKDENQTRKLSDELAEAELKSTKILAPIDGKVLKVFVKQGDVAINTPLLQIGNLSKMHCVAEVADRMVQNVKLGQEVLMTSQALPRPLAGTVSRIEKVVGNSTLFNPNPFALVEQQSVNVHIEIAASDNELAAQLINLQVDVQIGTATR